MMCITNIALPFPVQFYDQTFNSANVVQTATCNSVSDNTHSTNILPAADSDHGFPGRCRIGMTCARMHNAGCATYPGGTCGIFTSVTGTAPNRDVEH